MTVATTLQQASLSNIGQHRRRLSEKSYRAGRFMNSQNGLESMLRFGAWADGRRSNLTARVVQDYIGCSRATAYRYLQAYRAARGLS